MSKIITSAGQKGGTGKSVTTVNLAASLALLEKNTLVIDFDPKANTTKWCGINEMDYNCDITTVLSGRAQAKDAILKTQFTYLDVLPSSFTLFQTALKLSKTTENQKILRLLLEDVKEDYDYIIIDAPSSYDYLSVAAMSAANWLVVCMSIELNYLEDFHNLLKIIKYIRKQHDISLKIAGFLFNRCRAKQDILSFLENRHLGDIENLVFDSFIPSDEKVTQSIDLNLPLALHDIKSPAAQAYLNFAKELDLFLQ